jgi:hypothetical protein
MMKSDRQLKMSPTGTTKKSDILLSMSDQLHKLLKKQYEIFERMKLWLILENFPPQ